MDEIKAYNGGMNDAARLTDFTRHNAEDMIFYRSWMRLTDYKKKSGNLPTEVIGQVIN